MKLCVWQLDLRDVSRSQSKWNMSNMTVQTATADTAACLQIGQMVELRIKQNTNIGN